MAGEMIADRIKVIDADTHITEPYDLFTSRVSTKRWGDKVPHVRRMLYEGVILYDPKADVDTERDIWVLNGEPSIPIGVLTMAGWPEWPPAHPSTLDEFDPASYDSTKRLERMDEYGVYAQVLYPNVGGFGATGFLKLEDPELMLACVRAYNDFQTDFCSVDAKRLIPNIATPFWDRDEAVKEIIRAHKMGHKAILFPQSPQFYGGQPISCQRLKRGSQCGSAMFGSPALSGVLLNRPARKPSFAQRSVSCRAWSMSQSGTAATLMKRSGVALVHSCCQSL